MTTSLLYSQSRLPRTIASAQRMQTIGGRAERQSASPRSYLGNSQIEVTIITFSYTMCPCCYALPMGRQLNIKFIRLSGLLGAVPVSY